MEMLRFARVHMCSLGAEFLNSQQRSVSHSLRNGGGNYIKNQNKKLRTTFNNEGPSKIMKAVSMTAEPVRLWFRQCKGMWNIHLSSSKLG